MELRDAHCHYQFAEVPYAAVEQARADGVGQAMINGSAPSDWEDVAASAGAIRATASRSACIRGMCRRLRRVGPRR